MRNRAHPILLGEFGEHLEQFFERGYTPHLNSKTATMDILAPITKEAAADLLSVSKRTINNWIADGTLPAPSTIGRRIYWHPVQFQQWLDAQLSQSAPAAATPPNAPPPKRGRPRTIFPA